MRQVRRMLYVSAAKVTRKTAMASVPAMVAVANVVQNPSRRGDPCESIDRWIRKLGLDAPSTTPVHRTLSYEQHAARSNRQARQLIVQLARHDIVPSVPVAERRSRWQQRVEGCSSRPLAAARSPAGVVWVGAQPDAAEMPAEPVLLVPSAVVAARHRPTRSARRIGPCRWSGG